MLSKSKRKVPLPLYFRFTCIASKSDIPIKKIQMTWHMGLGEDFSDPQKPSFFFTKNWKIFCALRRFWPKIDFYGETSFFGKFALPPFSYPTPIFAVSAFMKFENFPLRLYSINWIYAYRITLYHMYAFSKNELYRLPSLHDKISSCISKWNIL